MALIPVTEEDVVRIAAEEGVPLGLAMAVWFRETKYGTHSDTTVSPQERGLRTNTNPDKIGKGSFQVIRGTFNESMPGVDYDTATDQEITRAGMRKIKSSMNVDGTFDPIKVFDDYTGRGIDAESGKRLADDWEIKNKMLSIYNNVTNNMSEGSSAIELAEQGASAIFNSSGSVADQAIKSLRDLSNQLQTIDPVAAEQKRQEAQDLSLQQQQTILDEQVARQAKILDDFGTNPAGVYDEIFAVSRALRDANSRLRNTVRDLNYQNDYGDGLGGALLSGLANFGAKLNYDKQVKQVQDLSKSVQEYNAVIQGFQQNAAAATPQLSQFQAMQQEARAAGDAAISLDLTAAQLGQQIARTEASLIRQQATTQAEQDRIELARERESNRANEARIRALHMFGTDDIDALNAATAIVVKTIDPNAVYSPFTTLDAWNKIYGKDKVFVQAVAEQLRSGFFDSGVPFDVTLDYAQNNANEPALAKMASEVSIEFDKRTTAQLDAYAKSQGKDSWVQYEAMPDYSANGEKNRQALIAQAKENAKESFKNMATKENSFNSNPLNYKPLAMYIEAEKDQGLKKLLVANGIDPTAIQNDVGLFGELQIAMEADGLTADFGTVSQTLANFYKDLAEQRSKNPFLRELKISLSPSDYAVENAKGDTFNLTRRETGVQRYWEAVKSARAAKRRERIIEQMPIPGYVSNPWDAPRPVQFDINR